MRQAADAQAGGDRALRPVSRAVAPNRSAFGQACHASPLRILIIDDHRLFTAGLAAVLKLLPQTVDVFERDNARTALREIEAGLCVDLLLVDVEMPSLNGLDLLIALAHRGLMPTSIVISASSNPRLVSRVLAAGAKGFVPKSLPPANIIAAIQTVLQGGTYVPDDLKGSTRASHPPVGEESLMCPLSGRQLEVLGLITRGRSNKEIADVLDVSVSTVKFHVSALFRVLNVRTRTECVHVARERALMS